MRDPRAPRLIGFILSTLPERYLRLGMMAAVAMTAAVVGMILLPGVGLNTAGRRACCRAT